MRIRARTLAGPGPGLFRYTPAAGDVLAFSGTSPVSLGIRWRTFSRYSHVGVVAQVTPLDIFEHNGRLPTRFFAGKDWAAGHRLFESTTMVDQPCELLGRRFDGFQCHRPANRLDGYAGRVWVLRPKQELLPSESVRLTAECLDRIGTSYDAAGALIAGTRVLKHLGGWFGLADRAAARSTLYCVEAVEQILLDALPKWRWPCFRPGRDTPAACVRQLVRSGLYHPPRLVKA